MVLVKNLPFLFLFRSEKVFGDGLKRKLASKDYKNIRLRNSQNFHFLKGARQWFW